MSQTSSTEQLGTNAGLSAESDESQEFSNIPPSVEYVDDDDGHDDNENDDNDVDHEDIADAEESEHTEDQPVDDRSGSDSEDDALQLQVTIAAADGSMHASIASLTSLQIFNLLSGNYIGFPRLSGRWNQRVRHRSRDPDRFPKVPSAKGVELMNSGAFGVTNDRESLYPLVLKKINHSEIYRGTPTRRLTRRLLERQLAIGDYAMRRVNQAQIAQELIPANTPDMIINYDLPAYSGQFSNDGNFFYVCARDFKVRMYDTSNPYDWKHYKTAMYLGPSHWTLTDASLSPDNAWLAYTSLCSSVALAPTDPDIISDPYLLNLGGDQHQNFRIFSIRFSGDGRELIAGNSLGDLVVYDIASRTLLHQIPAHQDDVNAVCFADSNSPHVLCSGSDDAIINIWDKRSMTDESKPVGCFAGHIEGITYIDSKEDGHYILSNGKDQSMKLWDLRMPMSNADFLSKNPCAWASQSAFDYRWGKFPDEDWYVHPHDNSVVTFRGHQVLQTLIRCHFSPPNSTNSRYVYTGSFDGKVWIYNMDATVAGIIDVMEGTRETRPRCSYDAQWETCVRDASWHPHLPIIAASALNGWDQRYGTCSVHSYHENGEIVNDPSYNVADCEMARRLDPQLREDDYYWLKNDPS